MPVYTWNHPIAVRSDSGQLAHVGIFDKPLLLGGTAFCCIWCFAFIVDCWDKLRGWWLSAFQKQHSAGIKLCRLGAKSASGVGLSPSAAPVGTSVTGWMTPLAMGPVALVAVLILGCVNGIWKGKVWSNVGSHISGPARAAVVDAVMWIGIVGRQLFGLKVVFVLLPLYPLSIEGTQGDI